MRGVAILGSTGSIGTSTLNVLSRHRDRFRVVALVAGSNGARLEVQAREWAPAYHALAAGDADSLVEASTHPDVDIVVNGVVGAAGLPATLAALRAGKRVALANKEALVMAGSLMRAAAVEGGGEIVPVDSEHSAVLQCLTATGAECVRLTLTASGGPFRTWEPERVANATVSEALNHPTWEMGRKITVDSATLANKALEVIEAHFLFDMDYADVDVVVHPQSIVHAFVAFADGSVLAQLGWPSMELPILYALTHPGRVNDPPARPFDAVEAGALTFEPVRHDVFRTFGLGVQAGRDGGTAPAVFNAANEVAVQGFLDGRIRFGAIADVIHAALDQVPRREVRALTDVVDADAAARQIVEGMVC